MGPLLKLHSPICAGVGPLQAPLRCGFLVPCSKRPFTEKYICPFAAGTEKNQALRVPHAHYGLAVHCSCCVLLIVDVIGTLNQVVIHVIKNRHNGQ